MNFLLQIRKYRIFALCALIISMLAMSSLGTFAGSYDAYVDAEAESGGDGSKDEPYTSIKKALKEGAQDIYIYAGQYSDDLTVEEKTTLVGEDTDDVIISGAVDMHDDSELKKLTVTGRGIKVLNGADAELRDVIVRDTEKNAIETLGRGTLTIRDSSIYKSDKKGMYIQWGKDVDITNSKVYKNAEEGIDIRANVDGVISGCEIYDNGESGIEVILGDSELRIKNNDIQDNGSSGISAQYYSSAKEVGVLRITGNELEKNKNYGIDCKAPSGGNPKSGYWSDSMTLESNVFEKNKIGDINLQCGVKSSSEKKEEEKNEDSKEEDKSNGQAQNQTQEQKKDSIEEDPRIALEKALEEQRMWEENMANASDNISVEVQGIRIASENIFSQEDQKSKVKIFFVGYSEESVIRLEDLIQENKKQKESVEELLPQIRSEKNKVKLQSLQEEVSVLQTQLTEKIQEYTSSFSLAQWFRNLWG